MTDRRAEIVDAATEIFSQRGIQATTVRQIASKAGMYSGSLYHHFESKSDIVDAVVRRFFDGLIDRYRAIVDGEGTGEERYHACVLHAFRLIVDDPPAVIIVRNEMDLLITDPRFVWILDREREIQQLWIGLIEVAKAEGSFRSDLDSALLYRVSRDIIAGAGRWFRPHRTRSIDEFADDIWQLLLTGIRR